MTLLSSAPTQKTEPNDVDTATSTATTGALPGNFREAGLLEMENSAQPIQVAENQFLKGFTDIHRDRKLREAAETLLGSDRNSKPDLELVRETQKRINSVRKDNNLRPITVDGLSGDGTRAALKDALGRIGSSIADSMQRELGERGTETIEMTKDALRSSGESLQDAADSLEKK